MQRMTNRAAAGDGFAMRGSVVAMAAACGLAAGLLGIAADTANANSSPINVLAAAGPNSAGSLTTGIGGTYFSQFDHISASPGGRIVVVGGMGGTLPGPGGVQGVWVLKDSGEWRMVARMGVTQVGGAFSSTLLSLLGPPIVNDDGDVLLVGNVALSTSTGGSTTAPSVLRIDTDGNTELLLRMNTPSSSGQPGVPLGMPTGMSVNFAGTVSDSWRFTTSGAYYASMTSGLLSDCGSGPMCFRTFINRSQSVAGSAGSTIGTAVPVGSARNTIGLSSAGFGFQHVSMSGYTQNQLAGLLMFDQWGLPTLAVRDGTTPIDGRPDQFILATFSGQDTNLRAGVNSGCQLSFTGRFGVPPVNTGFTNTVPIPSTAPLGLFIKQPYAPARLIAQASTTESVAAAAPGVPGWRFGAFSTPVINAGGTTVFAASLMGPSTARASLWIAAPGQPPRAIAVTGVESGSGSDGAPPGVFGAQFTAIRSEPMLNRRGQVVFYAQISEPTANGNSVSEALCAYDPAAGVSIVARTGENVMVPGIGDRALTVGVSADIGGRPMAATGNDDGAATLLTDDGTVVFRATAVGVGAIVASARLETPQGACCAGSTCGVQAQLDCTGDSHRFVGVNTVCITDRHTASCCPADFDQSGSVSVQDLFSFIQSWAAGSPMADLSADTSIGVDDLIGYVQSYVRGCP
jgi:hypothetical protein